MPVPPPGPAGRLELLKLDISEMWADLFAELRASWRAVAVPWSVTVKMLRYASVGASVDIVQ